MCCFILSLHFPHSLYLFGCIQFENILGWKKENLKLRKLEYKFLALQIFIRKIQAIPWKCCKCIVHHRARAVGNQKRMFTFFKFRQILKYGNKFVCNNWLLCNELTCIVFEIERIFSHLLLMLLWNRKQIDWQKFPYWLSIHSRVYLHWIASIWI